MAKQFSRSFLWIYPVVLALAFAVFGLGIYVATRGQYELLSAGCVSVFVVISVWALAQHLAAARTAQIQKLDESMAPVHERLQHLSVLLHQVSEQQLLSERAKAIAYRESERDALRRAIREEISRKDYEAAIALANDIEAAFGYRQEAERFREEVRRLQQEEARRTIAEGAATIERHCKAEAWTSAQHEAERLLARYPEDQLVQRLMQDIEDRRQDHKRQLLSKWDDAIHRHDVDGGIEVLKQLDPYLTPQEAEAIQETARRIFKDKLQLLGQQFTLAIRDHHWMAAIQLGETIVRDFPNSRMAQEVREKMDLLRQRASEPEGAVP